MQTIAVAPDELATDHLTLPDNHASIRVMEKAGLQFERAILHRDKPHLLYRINA
jgi:RimJ/RimL family protein N-acetyltransferase